MGHYTQARLVLLVIIFLASTSLFAAPREVLLRTARIDGVVHWTPSKVEVTEGETVTFVAKHDLDGPDFHGFQILPLKIEKSVHRGKPLRIKQKITLTPGDYQIACQFHPAHASAMLIVKPKKELVSPPRVP